MPSRKRPAIEPGQQWNHDGIPAITIVSLIRHTVPDTTLWLVRRYGKRDVVMSEGYIWVHYQLNRVGQAIQADRRAR